MLAIRGVWIRLLKLERRRFLPLQIAALSSEFRCSFGFFFDLNVLGADKCSAKSKAFLEAALAFYKAAGWILLWIFPILPFQNICNDLVEDFLDCLLFIRHAITPLFILACV
jgi:hypothetical protein